MAPLRVFVHPVSFVVGFIPELVYQVLVLVEVFEIVQRGSPSQDICYRLALSKLVVVAALRAYTKIQFQGTSV